MSEALHALLRRNFHAKVAWVDPERSTARDELREILLAQLESVRALLRSVEDPTVTSAQLAHVAAWLERLDDRRNDLIRVLREEATEVRMREEERSVRQFVLRALEELQVPQNAGFIQEYVWAREGVDLNTRGFGALRRDDRRSWSRHPGRRLAYIVPVLAPDGIALAQWMARSDWSLDRRIAPPGADRVFDLHKLRALLGSVDAGSADMGDPFILPIEKYAGEILGVEPPGDVVPRQEWIAKMKEAVRVELASRADEFLEAQRSAAVGLAVLPEEYQLWGVPGGRRASDSASVRGA